MGRGNDDTLPASPGKPTIELDATLASGQRASIELDATAAPRGSIAPPVPAGRASIELDATVAPTEARLPDYHDLVPVDVAHYSGRAVMTQGGMGRIVVAHDRRLRRRVAIKELRTQSAALRVRFEREALLTARLQHPSIVSIYEAGRWPSGEPFYAMKLVPGRPFDQVIAAASTLDQRMGLLPHVLAIADALAYAHKERVIHRDLKPQNVLVGEFGETVVIDWGLAKDLTDIRPEIDAGPYRASGEVGATRIGDVLGTPAYMPPEQAEGQPADERADVYAIGAILYYLLAGDAPYAGSTSGEILEAVRRGAPVPLRERQPGLPSDLLAIVDRSMAREPANRYPSGRELAEDLRRFQAGQLVGAHRYSMGQLVRRWLRRHRTPVLVGSVALVVLAAVGAFSLRRIILEQERAEAERAAAERHRADAEELTDFMLGDVHRKLEQVGKLELLDSVARKAGDYYRRQAPRSPEEMWKRAAALQNIGDVLRAQGDEAAALAEYGAARQIREAAAWQGVARIRKRIGDVLMAQGKQDQALAEYRAILAIGQEYADRGISWQVDLSIAHNKVGDVLMGQGDKEAALAEYKAGHAIRSRVAEENPDDLLAQRDLTIGHERIGFIAMQRGDLPAALAEFKAALAIAEKVAATDAKNAIWQRDLAIANGRVGSVLQQQGYHQAALERLLVAQAVSKGLTQMDPTNAVWQRDLAVGHGRIGDVLLGQEDPAAALVEYRKGLAVDEKLAAQDASNAKAQHHVAIGHFKVARALAGKGELGAALAAFRRSAAIDQKLVASDPTNATWQDDLAVTHQAIGDLLLRDRNQRAAALVEYRGARALVEKLAAGDPSDQLLATRVSELAARVERCCR
jgi:tetratricopeptide (TPR) repeat protein/tRNA A-37 threonylcarbamoyl transferase component Bud32